MRIVIPWCGRENRNLISKKNGKNGEKKRRVRSKGWSGRKPKRGARGNEIDQESSVQTGQQKRK